MLLRAQPCKGVFFIISPPELYFNQFTVYQANISCEIYDFQNFISFNKRSFYAIH